jgi:hypothetical protein
MLNMANETRINKTIPAAMQGIMLSVEITACGSMMAARIIATIMISTER